MNGGQHHFTPAEVKYQALNGEVETRTNSAIPAPFGQPEHRDNVQAVAAVIGQIVKNEGGEWQSAIMPVVWTKVFSLQELSVGGLTMVAKNACKILMADKIWVLMSAIDKSATTGLEMLSFIRGALDRCDAVAYDLINTSLVVDGLGAFERRGKDWINVEVGGKPKIPTTCYRRVKNCGAQSRKLLSPKYPGVYWYLGGYTPRVALPPFDHDMKSVILALSRLREVQGPDSCVTSILCGMRDFSGLTDEAGKRCQFFLATTLTAWLQRRQVDLQLFTVGDHMFLISSLNKWRRVILETPKSQRSLLGFYDESGEGKMSDPAFCNVRFLLPRHLDMPNVHSSLVSTVIDTPREGSVIVFYNDQSLPTSGIKGTQVDFDSASLKLVPAIFLSHDFICYSPIYGAAPWMNKDQNVARSRSQSTAELKPWPKDPFVYQFGNSTQFRGIMTTLKNFALIGWGYSLVAENKWDMSKPEALVRVPLKIFETQESWYRAVYKDITIQMIGWLRPRSRYSPISNLPCMSKAGVVAMLSKVEGDEGQLLGNVVTVAGRETVGTRIAAWDDEEDIPDHENGGDSDYEDGPVSEPIVLDTTGMPETTADIMNEYSDSVANGGRPESTSGEVADVILSPDDI